MNALPVFAGISAGMIAAASIGIYLFHRARRERIRNQARIHGGDLWAAG